MSHAELDGDDSGWDLVEGAEVMVRPAAKSATVGCRSHWPGVIVCVVGTMAAALLALGALTGGKGANAPARETLAVPPRTIMIDCGSSGTRLKIFEQVEGKVAEVEVKDPLEMDALSDYVDEPGGVDKDLKSMINGSLQYVPKEYRAETPLYMYATAGMRMLPAEDQHAVFAKCRSLLENRSFSPYKFEDARTMSGEMEAAFSYLSVNYKNSGGTLEPPSMGQVEMGGASLQVAFRPEFPVLDHSWVYELLGKHETIYAKSYMGFGQNLARRRSQEVLLRQHNSSTAVTYPCFLDGYEEKVPRIEGKPDAGQVTLKGSSDYKGCIKLIERIMHTDYECNLKPCAMSGEYMPGITGQFVGISGFKYALLNMGLDLRATTPGQLRAGVEKFCGQKFSDLPGKVKFLKYECFLGSYAYSILRSLGFTDNSTNLSFEGDYSWTLGAAVYDAEGAASKFGSQPPGRMMLDQPGLRSVPPMDHRCYWSCRSGERCSELAAGMDSACKQSCSSKCM